MFTSVRNATAKHIIFFHRSTTTNTTTMKCVKLESITTHLTHMNHAYTYHMRVSTTMCVCVCACCATRPLIATALLAITAVATATPAFHSSHSLFSHPCYCLLLPPTTAAACPPPPLHMQVLSSIPLSIIMRMDI